MLKEHDAILRDVFINPDISNYVQYLRSEDFKFYRTYQEAKGIITINHLPSWTIKPKYKIIDYEVNADYIKNIRLIRKLEYFLESEPFQILSIGEKFQLINESYLEFNKNTLTVIYREIYSLNSIVENTKHPDYYTVNTDDEIFHKDLNRLLSSRYTDEYLDKDFIDLSEKEIDALIMYWR
jgi:hypothetical protein